MHPGQSHLPGKGCRKIVLWCNSATSESGISAAIPPAKQVCCPPLVPNARASLEGRNPSPLVSSVVSAPSEQGSSLLDLSLFSEVGTPSDGVLFVTKGFKQKHVFKAWYNKSHQDFFHISSNFPTCARFCKIHTHIIIHIWIPSVEHISIILNLAVFIFPKSCLCCSANSQICGAPPRIIRTGPPLPNWPLLGRQDAWGFWFTGV